jgi:hypothetical protein
MAQLEWANYFLKRRGLDVAQDCSPVQALANRAVLYIIEVTVPPAVQSKAGGYFGNGLGFHDYS